MHQRSRRASRVQEVGEQVQHLRVQDRRSLEVLSGCGRAGENEYPRADDRANAQGRQRPRAKRLLEPMTRLVGLRYQFVDGLAAQKLMVGCANRRVHGVDGWWLGQRVSVSSVAVVWGRVSDPPCPGQRSRPTQAWTSAWLCRVPSFSLCAWPNRGRIRGASTDYPPCVSCAPHDALSCVLPCSACLCWP